MVAESQMHPSAIKPQIPSFGGLTGRKKKLVMHSTYTTFRQRKASRAYFLKKIVDEGHLFSRLCKKFAGVENFAWQIAQKIHGVNEITAW
jgi:hypothetical protein